MLCPYISLSWPSSLSINVDIDEGLVEKETRKRVAVIVSSPMPRVERRMGRKRQTEGMERRGRHLTCPPLPFLVSRSPHLSSRYVDPFSTLILMEDSQEEREVESHSNHAIVIVIVIARNERRKDRQKVRTFER